MRIVPITIHKPCCTAYICQRMAQARVLSAGEPPEIEPAVRFLLILRSQIIGGI
jgi:hypothetical protein